MSEDGYRYMPVAASDIDYVVDLAADPRIALLARCVADQQSAGFKNLLDLREMPCGNCGSPGFNTGWGYTRHVCGASWLSDGDPSDPCGDSAEAAKETAE